MTREELIGFLERAQRWRKGADIPMPHPRDLSIAYGAVIRVLRDSDEDVVDFVLRDFEFEHYGRETGNGKIS